MMSNMPIETVERLLHYRTRKNQHVMRNIARIVGDWATGSICTRYFG
jgi:hypothetical protein